QALRIVDHASRLHLGDRHRAAPAVDRHQRIVRVAQRGRVVQYLANPAMQRIAGIVDMSPSAPTKTVGVANVSPGSRRVLNGPGSGLSPTVPSSVAPRRFRVIATRPLNSTPTYQPPVFGSVPRTSSHGMISRASPGRGCANVLDSARQSWPSAIDTRCVPTG